MVDKELIRRYSLTNASEHMGKANAKSVLSNILGDNPKLRKNVMEIKSEVEEEVKKINKWSEKKQKKELEKLGKIEKEEKKEKKELPEMVGAKRGEFVVRFAPNPNGPLHLGSARPAVINHEYTKKYDGKFILRFDDTDPVTKVPKKKFYKMIEEDLNWLGIEPDEVYRASNRLDKYKEYAIKAIEEGLAYVCTCERKEWSKKKNKGIACPCRDNSVKKNKKRWKKMVEHKFKEGQATLKIKTDLEEKNPAVRDWTAYRIVEESKHPYDKKEHLWPLYNFQSAIDDHLLGTTHILRGQEHSTNESKQQYLYKAFEWDYPVTVVMGRFNLQGMDLSTSKIREKIKKRELYGWDDLRTGTLRALKRRGFHPEAIHHLVMKIGNKPSDITISIENLASINRKLIDSEANRYFFVSDPVKITLDKRLKKSLTLPAHPDKPKGEKGNSG